MKIRSKNVNVYGLQISLPYDIGTLSVDKDGVIEIPAGKEEDAAELVKSGAFEIISNVNSSVGLGDDDDEVVKNAFAGSKKNPAATVAKKLTASVKPAAKIQSSPAALTSTQGDKKSQSATDGTTLSDKKTPLSDEEKTVLRKALLTKSAPELKKLCADLPKEEWESLDKSNLIKYLLKNSFK